MSGSSDSDKNSNFRNYYFGNYNSGTPYKKYFPNADSYTISNYPEDKTEYDIDESDMIFIDLEKEVPKKYVGEFDVVFNHTVFEHIFDIFTAFKNLCSLSKDIVIFVVPQSQRIHDYHCGYKDYWRFTPFSVDRLFLENGFKILYRETTYGFSESMYLVYFASKKADKWSGVFPQLEDTSNYINKTNDGLNLTILSKYILLFDNIVRKIVRKIVNKHRR